MSMKKAFSFLLLFSLMASTMQLHVGTHFCGDDLKSLAFWGKATPCAHAAKSNDHPPSCHSSKSDDDYSKGCCNDKELDLWSIDITTSITEFNFDFSTFSDTYLPPFINEQVQLISSSFQSPAYFKYKPPLIRQNLIVAFQSFLI